MTKRPPVISKELQDARNKAVAQMLPPEDKPRPHISMKIGKSYKIIWRVEPNLELYIFTDEKRRALQFYILFTKAKGTAELWCGNNEYGKRLKELP